MMFVRVIQCNKLYAKNEFTATCQNTNYKKKIVNYRYAIEEHCKKGEEKRERERDTFVGAD